MKDLIMPIIIFIIFMIANIVNNINATALERKLMSNFQKIKITFSIAIISSILFVIIWITTEDVIFLFIISFIVYFILFFLVDIWFHFKNKKFKFFIEHDVTDASDTSYNWEIIKVTKGKDLLIKKVETSKDKGDSFKNEFYKIIKNEINIPIKVVIDESNKKLNKKGKNRKCTKL